MKLCRILAAALPLFAAAPTTGYAGGDTVLRGTVIETHNRLSPDPANGLRFRWDFEFRLSGANVVDETWERAQVDGSGEAGTLGPVRRQSARSVLGVDGGTVSWRVLGDKGLQRMNDFPHWLVVMNFKIDARSACHLEMKFLPQRGFTSVQVRRLDNGQLANISLPRVVGASCTIGAI